MIHNHCVRKLSNRMNHSQFVKCVAKDFQVHLVDRMDLFFCLEQIRRMYYLHRRVLIKTLINPNK